MKRYCWELGVVFVFLNVLLGEVFGFKMGSVTKFPPSNLPLAGKIIAVLKAFSLTIVVFYLLGLIVNKRTRLLDIANTFLIGVIPIMIITPLNSLPYFKEALDGLLSNPLAAEPSQVSTIMLLVFIAIPFVVYSFVIYFNCFRTATNMKHWYHIVMFVLALFIVPTFNQFI